jgi:hypothetical protein
MKKLLSTNTLVLLVTLLLSLAVVEFFLRGFLPEDMGTTWDLRVPHPEFGWSLQPDISYHYRMAADMIHVEHNSKGFHDFEHRYENPEGVSRIVVLGDSFMEAFSVHSGDTLYSQLAGQLQTAGREVEVINLGVGGYGTLQEYLVYLAEGRRYRPDVVLLGFYFGNDLRNNLLELEKIVNVGTMKAQSRPFLDPDRADDFVTTPVDYAGAMQRYDAALQDKDTIIHRLARHLATFRAVEMVVARLFPPDEWKSAASQQQEDFVGLGMHFCEEPAEFGRAWQSTRRILQQLNSEVQASGAELVIFTVPAEHEVDPALMQALEKDFYDPEALCLETAPAYRRLQEISDELGVTYIDLLPEFRHNASAGKAYFLADRHWNAAGHALAASRISEALLTRIPASK